MSEKLTLTFDEKTKIQIVKLKDRTNSTSYAEVVRKALDLLETQQKGVSC